MAQSAHPATPQEPPRELANHFPASRAEAGPGHSVKTPWIVVDGDSAAYGSNTPGERASITKLEAVLAEVDRVGIGRDVVVGPNLWRTRGCEKDYIALTKKTRVYQAPAKTEADRIILQLARKREEQGHEVYLMSNDTYGDYPGAAKFRRIGFVVTPEGWVLAEPELVTIKPGGMNESTPASGGVGE